MSLRGLGAVAVIGPTMNGADQANAGAVFDPRVWLNPPPDAICFHKPGVVAIPPTGDSATVVQLVIPPGKNAVVWQIANNFIGGGFLDGSGEISWQIFRDPLFRRAIFGFDNILSLLGTTQVPVKLSAPIRLFEKEVITLRVTNNTILAPTQLSTGLLGGWMYDKRHEQGNVYL
jgi:hypothetical protein